MLSDELSKYVFDFNNIPILLTLLLNTDIIFTEVLNFKRMMFA